MRMRHESSYDATADEVYAMLADPAFREASADAQNCVSVDVTITETDRAMSVVVDQIQRTQGLPSFAKKFAGDTTRAIQREEWSDERHATLVIETPGKPGSMSGTITLEDDGAGCLEIVELDVRFPVPLIGGKIERLMGDLVIAGMRIEQEVGAAWLAGE
ncbi:MAG: DUF2505 domain-containing protein [Nocardioides sp.]